MSRRRTRANPLVAWITLSLVTTLTPPIVAQATPRGSAPVPASVDGQRPGLEEDLDRYLAPLIAGRNFNGVVQVARHGATILEAAYGDADREHGVPNGTDTRFHIASVSKSLTAAAVLLLVDGGLIDLDDPVDRYIPDFPLGDRITLHHLLTHTSGIPDINRFREYPTLSLEPQTPGSLVAVIRTHSGNVPPGGDYSYSNSNYNVLAYVIERVSGESYGDFMAARVFGPVGMGSTAHHGDDRRPGERSAAGYIPHGIDELALAPTFDWSTKTGNGSLVSTAADLLAWDRALTRGSLLSMRAKDLMFSPHVGDRVGYGWFLGERFGRPIAYINGNSPGFSSYLGRYPDEGVAVVVLENNDIPLATRIGTDVAAMLFGEPYERPESLEPIPPDQTQISCLAGTYRFPYGLSFEIAGEGNHLTASSVWPRYPATLIPLANDMFFHRYYWNAFVFERDEDGCGVSLHWQDSPGTPATLDAPRPG